MIIISILTWQGPHKAIALVYAASAAELTDSVAETEIVNGSLAYTGDGKTFVFDGSAWNQLGA